MVRLNSFVKVGFDKRRRGRCGAYGGTCGRGHKGYKARSGSSVRGFEGGQTPIYRRLPMRGFNSNVDNKYTVLSLKAMMKVFNSKHDVIDNNALVDENLIHDVNEKVKLISSDVEIKSVGKVSKISVACVSSGIEKWAKKNNISVVLSK